MSGNPSAINQTRQGLAQVGLANAIRSINLSFHGATPDRTLGPASGDPDVVAAEQFAQAARAKLADAFQKKSDAKDRLDAAVAALSDAKAAFDRLVREGGDEASEQRALDAVNEAEKKRDLAQARYDALSAAKPYDDMRAEAEEADRVYHRALSGCSEQIREEIAAEMFRDIGVVIAVAYLRAATARELRLDFRDVDTLVSAVCSRERGRVRMLSAAKDALAGMEDLRSEIASA